MRQAELFPDPARRPGSPADVAERVRRAPERTFGPAYKRELDARRIGEQMERILGIMRDGKWRTLVEIELRSGDPPASISAQLRHLRKERFGAYRVEKRRFRDSRGLWEYRVLSPEAL